MSKSVKLETFWLLVLLAIPLAAQERPSNKGKPNLAAVRSGNESGPLPATNDPAYVIGADDVLDINAWKEPEITRTVPVRPDGKISLPLINDIQAAGFTPTQLATIITEKLKKYLTEPQVSVIVRTINSRRVYILGEVGRPGAYPLLPDMTVLQALSSAGGFTQFANSKKIYVLRSESGKQVKYPFNYRQVVAGQYTQQNIVLQPGDTIVVP